MFLINLSFLGLVLTVTASQCRQNPAIYHFSFGDVKGTVLSDGPLNYTYNPFKNIVVLDTPEGRVIVDPGSRGLQSDNLFGPAGLLFKNLRAAGITPRSIDTVLLTHGHPDHVSGLLKPDGTRAFPRATVYVGRREHDFWTTKPLPIQGNPLLDFFADSYRKALAKYTGQLRQVPGKHVPLKGVQFIPLPGHSPGHNAIKVTSQGETLIISGDTWMTKADQLQNPEWIIETETNSTDAFDSRVRMLKEVARKRYLVVAYHEQFPGLGYVTRDGDSFDWIPAPSQQLGTGVSQICPASR